MKEFFLPPYSGVKQYMLAAITEAVVSDPGLAMTNPRFICYLVKPLTRIPTLSPAYP